MKLLLWRILFWSLVTATVTSWVIAWYLFFDHNGDDEGLELALPLIFLGVFPAIIGAAIKVHVLDNLKRASEEPVEVQILAFLKKQWGEHAITRNHDTPVSYYIAADNGTFFFTMERHHGATRSPVLRVTIEEVKQVPGSLRYQYMRYMGAIETLDQLKLIFSLIHKGG